MSGRGERAKGPSKARVLKAPAVRRSELIDCAQRLFLSRGYEQTTINDVISETGLSKGAFYHHFRSKEDLLEAIAGRYAQDSLAFADGLQSDVRLDALQKLNLLVALGRDWKLEHIDELRATFTTLLKPENAMLYRRIVEAVFSALTPALSAILKQGQTEGIFDLDDADLAASALLWLGDARRPVVMQALTLSESDLEGAVALITARIRAEEALINRILGLPPGRIEILGSGDEVAAIVRAWGGSEPAPAAHAKEVHPS